MLKRIVSPLIAAWILSSSALAAGPYGIIQVGNWRGGAFTDDATRRFSYCAAGATYRSGIHFMVAVNQLSQWSLAFAHPSWQLRQGETIAIDLAFDAKSKFRVTGTALVGSGGGLVFVPMPTTSELIAAFRRSHQMSALAKGHVYEFDLNATSALLPALASCVARAKSGPMTAINIRDPNSGGGRAGVQSTGPQASSLNAKDPVGSTDKEFEPLRKRVEMLHTAGRYEEALPAAEAYVSAAREKHGEDHPAYAVAIGWKALVLQATNRLAEAEPLIRQALSINEKNFGPEHPVIALLLNRLAQVLYAKQQPEAERLIRRALAINEKSLGPEHPNLAMTLNDLAALLRLADRLDEAEPLVRRALSIYENALGPEHPNVSVALDNLAQLLQATNRLDEAEALYRRAVAIQESAAGPQHATVAVLLNRLAVILRLTNRLAEAEPLFRRALAINETSFGAEHLSVADTLANLAYLLDATGRPTEAESLFRRALVVREVSLGADHPMVASTLTGVAGLLVRLNRTAEAEPLYRRVVAINEKNFGSEDGRDETTIAVSALAFLLQTTDRIAEAETLYRRMLAMRERRYGLEHPKVADALISLAYLLKAANRFGEAEAPTRRALAIHENVPRGDPAAVGRTLAELADVLRHTRRLTEAEQLYRRALATVEANLGPDHWLVGNTLVGLTELLHDRGKLTETEATIQRLLAMPDSSFGPDHSFQATNLNRVGQLLFRTNRLADAEALYRRVLAIQERSSGPDHPYVAQALGDLAQLLVITSTRFTEAEQLLRRAVRIQEISLGPNHTNVANTITSLAQLLQATNRLEEAEPLHRRALMILESSFGPKHPLVAVSLNSMAMLLAGTNRPSEAEALIRRALAIQEKDDPHHWGVAITLNNLALLLSTTDRHTEAETLFRRALAIGEKTLGSDHWTVATALNNLAHLLQHAGRFDEAELLYRRAVTVSEASLGPNHPNVAQNVHNLAWLFHATGRLTEAEQLYRRSLATFEKSLGAEHPSLTFPLTSLAGLFAERGDWPTALVLHSRAKPILTGRGAVGLNDRTQLAKARLVGNAVAFRAHARAAYRADPSGVTTREEGFEAAQWALQTTTADALTQMSTRFAKSSGPLAALVRERQDLVSRRRAEDKRLLDAVGKADAKGTEAIRAAMVGLDSKLDAIDRDLTKEFPEYAELSRPKPLSIGAVQALLRPDETLIVFLDIPSAGKLSEETLAWGVTNGEVRWINIPLGTAALAERVAKLRCGLDRDGQWKRSVHRWEAKGEHCRVLRPNGLTDSEPLPFDLGVAHELYAKLLAPFANLTEGKSLIIVPSGPLTSLPFHVLVTEPPKGSALQEHTPTAWLALKQPVTVLPSVGGLQALRKLPPSRARQPYIAFGNPLIDGGAPNGMPAKLARAKQSCPLNMKILSRRVVDTAKGVPGLGALFRGGIDLAELRGLAPLPETADELCAVARALGALDREADTVWLGGRATETNLKALSRTSTLAQYRILHFATHGVLAGESEEILKARAEPALILSPPKDGTTREQLEEDDGLLSASEVAQLELDADWVVLSACNTAAGEKGNAEAFSGLARAFFYAKTRALLVSHWAVTSDAAVKLTTGTFDEMRVAPNVGRAEAFRRSMERLISSGHPHEAHPEYWAPFVVVGEGGAGG